MKVNPQKAGAYLINSRLPYLIFDGQGSITDSNRSCEAIFPRLGDYKADDGEINVREIILAAPETEDAVKLDYFLQSGVEHFNVEFTLPQEESAASQWYRLSADRQEDGYFFALINDITSQKLKETHLVHAKENAEKASISRSQFLANISHEIRTPIQTIIGMMELLTETRLDEEQTEYARQVRFSADVMLTLINDILDISKVEAGQLKIEQIEFDIVNVVERTVDLVSMEAHRKGLEILIDVDPELPELIVGDPSRIQQIILNLVKNAVKFTESGHITVTASVIHRSNLSLEEVNSAFIHFEVLDTGIGIKQEAMDRLFTQFFQADSSTTRKYGGTGLGLAISRNLVELMGGEIGVKQNTPKGSVFFFDLPLKAAANQPKKATLPLDPATRFLLVDDNLQTLATLTRLLSNLGYKNVVQATSGMFALAMLRSAHQAKWPFDIVLIDMIMPEMDGWRLAAEINKNRDINQVQMYLMVPEGGFGADAKMKLLEWFNGYLYKPVKKRLLVGLLTEHWHSSIDLEVVEELESADGTDEEGATTGMAEGSAVRAKDAIKANTPQENPAAAGMNILVAEDHPVNSKILKIFLEKEGATLYLAEDGKEATEWMEKAEIDLVFMDIQMPVMNGYESAQWMRSRGYTLPIIACTASAQSNEKEKCLSIGMTDILPKPYRKKDVGDIIRKTFPQGKKEREDHMEEKNASLNAVFDKSEFIDIMGGDEETAHSLVLEYLEQTTAHLAILEDHIKKGDREHAGRTAHLLKGSALNITAGMFAAEALKIEKGAAGESPGELMSHLERLKTAYAQLKAVLSSEGYL